MKTHSGSKNLQASEYFTASRQGETEFNADSIGVRYEGNKIVVSAFMDIDQPERRVFFVHIDRSTPNGEQEYDRKKISVQYQSTEGTANALSGTVDLNRDDVNKTYHTTFKLLFVGGEIKGDFHIHSE